MAALEATPLAGPDRVSYLQWRVVVAGALIASATSFVLMTFGSAIGLGVASYAPTWRGASWSLSLLSGLWILLVTIAAMALGGYVAGRMRSSWAASHDDEVEFRDGMHGIVTWALAVGIGALVAALITTAIVRDASDVASADPSIRASAGRSVPVAYEVDRLLRSDRPEAATVGRRAEIGRLLVAAATDKTFPTDERAHLVRLTSASTGLNAGDAEKRVSAAVSSLQDRLAAVRRSGVILAFMTAASLAAAAAAAWMAACLGGRHRDTASPPSLVWRRVPLKA